MDIRQVLCVFESGDYLTLGSSQHSDTQLWETIEQSAPPHFGKCVMTYFLEQPLNCHYLPDPTGWRQF